MKGPATGLNEMGYQVRAQPQVPDTEVLRASPTAEEMCGMVLLAVIIRAGGWNGGIKVVLEAA